MDKKIFRYELKRIIFSRMFIVTFILALVFCVIDFYFEIISGVSGTAPFSQWSYCKFLCDVNTILLLIVMFFCTDFFSSQEERVKEITLFTPVPYKKIWLSKSLAIFSSYFIVSLSCIILSLFFYKLTFNFTTFQNFLLPVLIILLPSFILVFGASVYLGSKSQTLLYILIPVIMLLSLMSFHITPFIDIFAKGYIVHTPKVAGLDITGEPIFKLSIDFIISRFLFSLLGIFLFLLTTQKSSLKQT